jgi:hypothetical protein
VLKFFLNCGRHIFPRLSEQRRIPANALAERWAITHTGRRKYRLSTPVLAGLDPAIGYPHPIANDAIPISNHPMKMTASCGIKPKLDMPYGLGTGSHAAENQTPITLMHYPNDTGHRAAQS